MKIGMIAPIPPPYGGIANWVALMDEYVAERENVSFVHVNTAPKLRATEGRTLWDRVVVQGFAMFGKNREMKRIICADKPDVIHMTTSGQLAIIRDTMMLRTAKKKRIPAVYHIRFGRIPEIAAADTREWRMLRKAMRMATKVMAIDTATERAIREYAPEVDVCCVPNPIDLRKLQNIRNEAGSGSRKELVFIGWVIKTKGVEELLTAWKTIREDYPEWMLRIVGPCAEDYRADLDQRFSTDRVAFEGEREHSETMQILANADVFVLPSYTEGFPNAVLEAMALAKPIVATAVGAIPDMLADGCGMVIPPKDIEALIVSLRHALADGNARRAMGQKALAKMKEAYTVERVFDEYLRIWEQIQNKHRKA